MDIVRHLGLCPPSLRFIVLRYEKDKTFVLLLSSKQITLKSSTLINIVLPRPKSSQDPPQVHSTEAKSAGDSLAATDRIWLKLLSQTLVHIPTSCNNRK